MHDIYARLRPFGFDQAFVKQYILPEWWDDSLGDVPTNRAVAEGAIARMLGFSLQELADPKAPLTFPSLDAVRLKKHRRDHDARELRSTILLAEHAAAVLVRGMELLRFTGTTNARKAREAVLSRRSFVDLDALLDFAWSSGIAVMHLAALPEGLKKFSGLAMFAGNVPVIVLGSKRDSSPWLAFHLAHELGHIFLGHVEVGSAPLADVDLDTVDDDKDEVAADRFAVELLTGNATLEYRATYGMTAQKLVGAARVEGRKLAADPGTIALIYGRGAKRMGVAQSALKIMGLDQGAHAKIATELRARLKRDLPEVAERFARFVAPQ